jgi:hypothetical protein
MIKKVKYIPWVVFLSLILDVGYIDFVQAKAAKEPKTLTVELIPWGSDEGIQRFASAEFKVDFFKLANFFEAQNNSIYCGVASSVIVLNALRVRNEEKQNNLPKADSVLTKADLEYIPIIYSPFFNRYTQDNIFNEKAKSKLEILGKPIKNQETGKEKRDGGLQLAQLQKLLASHDLQVIKKVADDKLSANDFRKDLKTNLANKDDYILVNYTRKTLDQEGGGHISPIGAYDSRSDSVLVMDVNSNKADWVWVAVDLLYASMATFDTIENRGYLLISEKQ